MAATLHTRLKRPIFRLKFFFQKFVTFWVRSSTPLLSTGLMHYAWSPHTNKTSSKSAGPDGIPARVLKIYSLSPGRRLCNLFYISFKLANFPSYLQIAHVQSVPKIGNPSDPGLYQPIAICSKLAKIMESIINHKLMKYLQDNFLLNDRQYTYIHIWHKHPKSGKA